MPWTSSEHMSRKQGNSCRLFSLWCALFRMFSLSIKVPLVEHIMQHTVNIQCIAWKIGHPALVVCSRNFITTCPVSALMNRKSWSFLTPGRSEYFSLTVSRQVNSSTLNDSCCWWSTEWFELIDCKDIDYLVSTPYCGEKAIWCELRMSSYHEADVDMTDYSSAYQLHTPCKQKFCSCWCWLHCPGRWLVAGSIDVHKTLSPSTALEERWYDHHSLD